MKNLVDLPFDVKVLIINYLEIADLAYLSLVNRFFSSLLSNYRFFGKFKNIGKKPGLYLLIPEDSMDYGYSGYSKETEEVMRLLADDSLMNALKGIYTFRNIMFGMDSFEKLHPYISLPTRSELVVSISSSGSINWSTVNVAALKTIVTLISKTDVFGLIFPQHFDNITHILSFKYLKNSDSTVLSTCYYHQA